MLCPRLHYPQKRMTSPNAGPSRNRMGQPSINKNLRVHGKIIASKNTPPEKQSRHPQKSSRSHPAATGALKDTHLSPCLLANRPQASTSYIYKLLHVSPSLLPLALPPPGLDGPSSSDSSPSSSSPSDSLPSPSFLLLARSSSLLLPSCGANRHAVKTDGKLLEANRHAVKTVGKLFENCWKPVGPL